MLALAAPAETTLCRPVNVWVHFNNMVQITQRGAQPTDTPQTLWLCLDDLRTVIGVLIDITEQYEHVPPGIEEQE